MGSQWSEIYRNRLSEPQEALRPLKSGSRIFVGTAAGEPRFLMEKLTDYPEELADAELCEVWPLSWTGDLQPRLEGQ